MSLPEGAEELVLKTKYFGSIEIEESDVLTFPKGLFAFEDEKKFVLLPFEGSDSALLCLQSAADEHLAFVVMNPFAVCPQYAPVLQAGELEKLGVSVGSQILLKNYNFGLDDRIGGRMLSDVAAYAKEHVGGERDWGRIFKEKLLLYRYRSFHGGDAPYNLLVILGYGINIIAIVILLRRAGRELFAAGIQLFLVALVRSALWMFVLMRGRDPERITHPLYLVEFCLLAGIFLGVLFAGAFYGKHHPKKVPLWLSVSAVTFLLASMVIFCVVEIFIFLGAAGPTRRIWIM